MKTPRVVPIFLAVTPLLAAGTRDYSKYENELEITGRVLRLLSDDAFRNVALGENLFRFTGVEHRAPRICKRSDRSAAPGSGDVGR
jgi:hypothetical protein